MKKIHTPNHKLYEQYYLDQAKQKGGNLPAFHGARFQRGYGLGSIFRGLFRWAVPHLQQGAKMLGKKALQTGVSVAQDVLAGENLKTATKKRAKQALGLPSQNSRQAGAGQKRYKKESTTKKKQFASRQETENISSAGETRRQIFHLKVKWLLLITNLKSVRSQNSISLLFRLHKHLSSRGNGLSTTPSVTSLTLVP